MYKAPEQHAHFHITFASSLPQSCTQAFSLRSPAFVPEFCNFTLLSSLKMAKLHQILVVMVLFSVLTLQADAQFVPAPAPYTRGYPAPAPSPYAYSPESYPVPAPAYSPGYEAPAFAPGPESGL